MAENNSVHTRHARFDFSFIQFSPAYADSKDSFYKALCIEVFQILYFFSDTRKDDGQSELGCQRKDKPALCRAVQLGEYESVELYRLVEDARLIDGVLSRRSVENEQLQKIRFGIFPRDDAVHFLKLFHEIVFDVHGPPYRR